MKSVYQILKSPMFTEKGAALKEAEGFMERIGNKEAAAELKKLLKHAELEDQRL